MTRIRTLELHVRPEGGDGYAVVNGRGEELLPAYRDRSVAEAFIEGARYALRDTESLLRQTADALPRTSREGAPKARVS